MPHSQPSQVSPRRSLILLSAILALWSLQSANAAVFEVDNFMDTTNGVCSPDPNDCTLRGAVMSAGSNNDSDDLIRVPQGTYPLISTLVIDVPASHTLQIDGFGAVLQPSSGNRGISVGGGTVTIRGITVQNATAPGNGAGIMIERGTVTLSVVRLFGNHAIGRGGGLYVDTGSTAFVDRLIVRNNEANDSGGGIEVAGTMVSTGPQGPSGLAGPLVVIDNRASFGGGLHFSGGTAHLTRANIRDNFATIEAGGIQLDTGSNLDLVNSRVIRNRAGSLASGRQGGGLTMNPQSFLHLTNTTIRGNESAFCTVRLLDARIERSSIVSNSANHPSLGNVCIFGDVTLENSTLSGNSGSPLVLHGAAGLLRLESSTVVDEISVRVSATLTARSSILTHCSPDQPNIISLGYNVDDDDCELVPGSILIGNRQIAQPSDAGLEPLSGGVHALSDMSPALETGDPGCLDRDQRGLRRPRDGDEDGSRLCDSGAYELNPRGGGGGGVDPTF